MRKSSSFPNTKRANEAVDAFLAKITKTKKEDLVEFSYTENLAAKISHIALWPGRKWVPERMFFR